MLNYWALLFGAICSAAALMAFRFIIGQGLPWVDEIEFWRQRRHRKAVMARIEECKQRVFALPLDAARRTAEAVLEFGGFTCIPRTTLPPAAIHVLAPNLGEFFARWEEVCIEPDMTLMLRDDVDLWDPSFPEGIGISSTLDEKGALTVLPGDETVYEVPYSASARSSGERRAYPSIWHWIVIQSEIRRVAATESSG